jgi:hypothetical protein
MSESSRKLESQLTHWTAIAKSVNVYVIALSALIKKITLISRAEAKRDFPPSLVDSLLIGLMIRYDKLLNSLVDEWGKAVSVSVANEFERLHALATLDDDEEILEHSALIIERIDQLRYIDVREQVISTRARCEQLTKLGEISELLELEMETKLYLPVKRQKIS